MHCYLHPEKEAVGLCKVCSRGLCEDCAIEIGDFLYCDKHAKMSPAAREAKEAGVSAHPEAGFGEEEAPAPKMQLQAPPRPAARHAAPARAPERPFAPRRLIPVDFKSMLVPAVIGGIVSGTPSGIPVLNFACVAWMALGGAVSAYTLLLKESTSIGGSARIGELDAVKTGALSGVFGAGIAFIFSAFSGITFWNQMAGVLTSSGLGTDAANLLLQLMVVDPNLNVFSVGGKLVLFLVIFPVFGAIGAMLASRLSG